MILNARKALMAIAATATITTGGLVQASTDPLVVYSSRNEHLVKPLFDAYTAKTGVEIKYITDKAGPLLARLQAEGETSPADLLITVDAGNLWQASQQDVLQPVESSVLAANIPAHLRAENNQWFGLSVRARTLVYADDRVKPEELSSYEALSGADWKDRLCLRTAKKVYNQSLVATMIERLGADETESVVKGWVDNLATPVFSNDTKAMQAVAAGQCDVTIVNTYYFGRLQKKEPGINLKLFFANQDSSGVHVNISGAGVTKYAKNSAEAVRFLEWMSGPEAQRIIADSNMEYPANPAVKPEPTVAAWGEFKQDQLNVQAAGSRQAEAIKLMDRAGYR